MTSRMTSYCEDKVRFKESTLRGALSTLRTKNFLEVSVVGAPVEFKYTAGMGVTLGCLSFLQ